MISILLSIITLFSFWLWLNSWISNLMIMILCQAAYLASMFDLWNPLNSVGKLQNISPYRLLSCTAACLLRTLSRLLLKIMKRSVQNWQMVLNLILWRRLQMLSHLMIVNDVKTVIIKICRPRCEFSVQFLIWDVNHLWKSNVTALRISMIVCTISAYRFRWQFFSS